MTKEETGRALDSWFLRSALASLMNNSRLVPKYQAMGFRFADTWVESALRRLQNVATTIAHEAGNMKITL